MRFSSHYKMNNDDIIDYVFEHTDFFSSNENLICEEIGDGNINYVYRVSDTKTKKSLVLKQADIQTRVRPDGYLNPDRSVREAKMLKLQFKYAPEFIPKILYSDSVMASIIMEDIGAYSNLKKELMKASVFHNLGKLISDFIVRTTLPLTVLVSGYEKKSELATTFYNPELCKITEELVFTYPYNDVCKRNILFAQNAEWLSARFYNNNELAAAAAKLKEKFCSNSQSLIHGDLHSGSIFVNDSDCVSETVTKLKIIDPEFVFYGPIGYDLGNVLAHFILAETYIAYAANEITQTKKNDFLVWIHKTKKELFENFYMCGITYLKDNITDAAYKNSIFIRAYIEQLLLDAVGFCGAELNRRVIGSAKSAEITSIKNAALRIQVERALVDTGIWMMLNPEKAVKEICK